MTRIGKNPISDRVLTKPQRGQAKLVNIVAKVPGLLERAKAPTPKFFRVLRNIGLTLVTVSGAVLAAPVALPVALVTAATYVGVAGGVLSAVSQVTVDDGAKAKK